MKKLVFILFLALSLFASEEKMQIFKPVSSTCPQDWLDKIKSDVNESVDVVSMIDMKALKRNIGIPQEIQSCNTSVYKDFVFEGNVPSLAINDFLKNPVKNSIGLSLPAYENDKETKTVFVIFEDKTFKEYGKYK